MKVLKYSRPMKKQIISPVIFAMILFSAASSLAAKVGVENKVIYGEDGRVEIDLYPNSDFVKKGNAVAIRIPTKDLRPLTSSYFSFPDIPIQDSRHLCDGIAFNDQPSPGDCTGFLIGPKTLVTAGHCMRNLGDCEKQSWVFRFKANSTAFETSQIYSCKNIISQKYNNTDYEHADYAVIELDRDVVDATPLEYRKSSEVKKDTPLVVIGHPSGLPMKAADGAVVKTQGKPALNESLKKRPNYFAANLDTFGGNSGSPVFNQTTGLVEGILVKGRDDYKYDLNFRCYRLNYVEDNNDEEYELVMKINRIPGL